MPGLPAGEQRAEFGLAHRIEPAAQGRAEARAVESADDPQPTAPALRHDHRNPSCGTSRNTLALLRHAGIEPQVIEYRKSPLSRQKLRELIAAMGIPLRALLRKKGMPYEELGLDDPRWTDEQLLDFMQAHPILMNRPIVVTPPGTVLSEARPSSRLPRPPTARHDGCSTRNKRPVRIQARSSNFLPPVLPTGQHLSPK